MNHSQNKVGSLGEHEEGYDAASHFSQITFSTVNIPSTLYQYDVQVFREKYIFSDDCHLYTLKGHNRVYHTRKITKARGGVNLGISTQTLFCGLRFPLIQFLKNLF